MIQEEISVIEARALVEVVKERDTAGRVLYTNEKTRDAAVVVALADDEDYKELKKKREELRNEREDIRLEMHRLNSRKELLSEDGVFSFFTRLFTR